MAREGHCKIQHCVNVEGWPGYILCKLGKFTFKYKQSNYSQSLVTTNRDRKGVCQDMLGMDHRRLGSHRIQFTLIHLAGSPQNRGNCQPWCWYSNIPFKTDNIPFKTDTKISLPPSRLSRWPFLCYGLSLTTTSGFLGKLVIRVFEL